MMFEPPSTFWDALFRNIPIHTQFIRFSFFAACIMGGWITFLYLKQQFFNEERYKSYIHGAPLGILIFNDEGYLKKVNPAACNLTEYSEEALLKMQWSDLHAIQIPDGNDIPFRIFRESLPVTIDISLFTKTEKKIYVQIDAVLLPDLSTLIFFKDITEHELAQEMLKTNLKEKEILLSEVHHRVKNNLSIIISLLSLQSDGPDSGGIDSDVIETVQNRIFAMATVHEKLYQSDSFSHIDFTDYLETLSYNLLNIYTDKSKLDFQFDLDQIDLDIDIAIPCGLICTELITNAFKHAFKGGEDCKLTIRLKMQNQDRCTLAVEDNGVGMPKTLNIDELPSLGLKLVSVLTEQIGGEIAVKSDKGTAISISFPFQRS